MLLILILLSIFVLSCTSESRNGEVSVDLLHVTEDSLCYSSFVDSISYIVLEDNDDCLIGSVSDVIIDDEYIFVLDDKQQAVWIFSREGNYLNSINRRGSGPEEYIRLAQFEYDKQENELLILDGWTKSIIHYSLDGAFKKRNVLDVYCSDFKQINEGYILSMLGGVDDLGGIYHYSLNEGKSKKLLERSYNLSCSYNWELVSHDGNIGLMAPPLDNVLYRCCLNGELQENIPFRVYPQPSHNYENDDTMEHLSDFVRTNYLESAKWVYATYWCADYDLRVFLYDKIDGKAYVGKKLFNDMDGIPFTAMTSACDNNSFVFGALRNGHDGNPVLQILHLK